MPELDVIVLARGGGSFEDLLPFSDERLVRAVASCTVPVVSAVGHEQDTPLCDLAADVRASTPSVAARLVVPDADELVERLGRARAGLARGARRTVERDGERLERTRERLRRAPGLVVQRDRARLERSRERLRAAPSLILERRGAKLEHAAARLRALAPRATLERGYAIVRAGEQIVRSSAGLRASARIEVELADGRLRRPRRGRPPVTEALTFESAQKELEQIVERLETGQAPLDETIKLWERGEELYKFCREQLDAAHGKIEELARSQQPA